MRLGYNTNGLAHHSLPDAIRLLASLGYEKCGQLQPIMEP